ncbi:MULTISPECIES: helix-turn-helix domain-containing protein [unclassified Clostridioides]|uniref:helix-turn-helix domain-containing protein n=1 Tax=unclassified Clostridioides TaxID=2635829 RepID=UPI001D0C656C|nr:helix-turn-helix transcriptional regulator [Clostridioides sp. ES-S-0049-03]MCC0678192.1 helix-turn-helix transcriptional regulator [Clostridioides sp. ES-W-0018-02]MCC0705325.1 helix-turn-helix transcriptional regulator [Clostridioides sp. ES-S-0049-02]MCC0713066.1 helix-turn-helix transcriptional regulator [Clostridioides sp. ES-W-0017-02]MCC0764791.1 helix-turn-helix transcriptional regulator [Clostridioides sp. ES-S-0006-03]
MNRLRELRKEMNLSTQEIANKLNVHYTSIQNWENGRRKIDIDKLKDLAKLYDVSLDYITCLTDDRENTQLEEEEKQLLNNYRELDTKSKTIVQEQINTLKKLL